jgi:tRNA (cmo5U34)-methyltransferase
MERLDGEWTDSEFASRWAASADQINPLRRGQIDLIVRLLAGRGAKSVLDLGIGPGLIAERILEDLPAAHVIGLDSSPAMVELAAARLSGLRGRAQLDLADLGDPTWVHLVSQPVDAAISVQTLHNLEPARNREALFAAAKVVRPGGLLIIADRFSVQPQLFGEFKVIWDQLGVDEGATPQEHADKLKRHGDQPIPLVTALQWLDEAGFEAACLESHAVRAVIVAERR